MKILLVSANKLKEPYPVYPLGLDYVAGAIPEDHHVETIDINDFPEPESIKKKIREYSADIIGISIRNIDNTDNRKAKSFIAGYEKLIEIIRANSRAKIVLGGSGFTIFPKEYMKALDADYGIIGEGERFSQFIDALQKKKNPEDITGIITKTSPVGIPGPWNKNFKRRFNADSHHLKFYLERGGMLNLQTKRGCTFNCIYCTYPYIEGRNLRLIPPEKIAETARTLQEAGAKYFFITDSTINCDYDHSIATARAFIKAGVSIPWGAFFAPTRPPEDYYNILADAGLSHVEFGTESLSPRMLTNYRKPFQINDIIFSHEKALRAGLYTSHYLLFGGPGENSDTLNETLKNAMALKKTVFFIYCGIRIYPHTELYEIALKEGQIKKSRNLLEPAFYQSPHISGNEIIKRLEEHARDKQNWIIGTGDRKTARLIKRMYSQGYSGPLWENLIQ